MADDNLQSENELLASSEDVTGQKLRTFDFSWDVTTSLLQFSDRTTYFATIEFAGQSLELATSTWGPERNT